MSDRMCGCITIGGQLDRGNLPVLLRVITESGVSLEWGDAHFAPADADEHDAEIADWRSGMRRRGHEGTDPIRRGGGRYLTSSR